MVPECVPAQFNYLCVSWIDLEAACWLGAKEQELGTLALPMCKCANVMCRAAGGPASVGHGRVFTEQECCEFLILTS